MTYEEKVKWLRRYQDNLHREQELTEEVEQLRSRACKVTSSLTGMPGGTSDGQALPRAVEKILETQQELLTQINHCGVIRQEVVSVLEQAASSRDQEILRRRYLLGQKWEKIAIEMHLEYRWVRRLHKRAVGILPI